MRPFVYRQATERGVAGWVLNAGDGVHIEAHAEGEALEAFVRSLRDQAPAAAQVDTVDVAFFDETEGRIVEPDASTLEPAADVRPGAEAVHPLQAEPRFRIIASQDETEHSTLISPDIATCDDCLRELFDPADRRYHYPFINCTNCGPRFTIIRSLPYDRARTSMSAFPMCPACASEYADPLDRRFHAQPDACFACGPHITWQEQGERKTLVGATRETSDAIIARCAELIASDGIVAVKGLGGFHLACRADSEHAVRELRARKRRSNKPLAIMACDLDVARVLCHVTPKERDLLCGSVRPIVLLQRREGLGSKNPPSSPALARSIAFDLPELGIMLPYTPLQHLLMAECRALGIDTLVMTSGNLSEEPIEMDDGAAWAHLVESGIADALLGNDRAILSRFDDSVVRVVNGQVQFVRRARGYAPRPLALPNSGEHGTARRPLCVLACGSEQKATLALTREDDTGGARCFISQHIGDLENAETFDAWQSALTRMEGLFDLCPSALACDAHPGYLSSQWAREQAQATSLPLVQVQHHHAHIAAVIAEAAARGEIEANAQVIGIAFDGTGAGATYHSSGAANRTLELDGTIWGGEVLLASPSSFDRAAHLEPWPLPGGAASVRDPRRNAFALLKHYGLLDHPGAAQLLNALRPNEKELLSRMIDHGINCPPTSSMGRLLDAVGSILGICHSATYEGEPAILLEAAAHRFARRHDMATPSGNVAKSLDAQNGLAAPKSSSAPNGLTVPNGPGAQDSPAVPKSPDTSGFPAAPASNGPLGKSLPSTATSISMKLLLLHILDGIAQGTSPEKLAWDTHRAIVATTARVIIQISNSTGVRTAALSGGVFMNRLLLEGLSIELKHAGLTVLTPRDLPCNDGCIAYGQAAVARAQFSGQE